MTDGAPEPKPSRHLGPRYWPVWFGLGCLWLIARLPLTAQLWLGQRLGSLAYLVAGKRRDVVLTNLTVCFPDWDAEKRQRVCKMHFQDLGASLFEMASAWWREDALFERNVTFRGDEAVRDALAAGHRLIIVTGHFTTLEISGRFLRQIVPSLHAIYRPHRNALLDERVRRGRLRSAQRLIEKADIRQMLRSLKQGVSVWYAPDQSYRRKYAELIDFFGIPAMTNTATGRLAALSGAKVVPFYCWRDGAGPNYVVEFLPPLDVAGDDLPATTRQFVATLEDAICKAPSQYFWIHRKFKGRPEGYPDLYATPLAGRE
ncbi:MAG: lipid A biosynthesis acyltransferase [Pseudomonadota bacterium]